ncbi:MAG: 5-formyltetrahydrofolate cyclo-ligase [Pseudomonadota bacterium]
MVFHFVKRLWGRAPDPQKVLMRERAKAIRAQAFANRPDAAPHAARHFLEAIAPVPGSIVALYAATGTELATRPLAEALHDAGLFNTALPVVEKRDAPLIFRRFSPGMPLVKGAFGIETPPADADAVIPTHVIVPLLAFSRDGARLGYGGGYYDRTLAHLRQNGPVVAIGYGFGAQEVDAVPTGALDEPLDWIVTERGAVRVNR